MASPNSVLTDQELKAVSMITATLERTSRSLAEALPEDSHEAMAAVDSLTECIDYLKILSHKQATFWPS